MKLRKGFVLHQSGDDYILVGLADTGFNGMLRCNDIGGAMLEILKNDCTEETLFQKMMDLYKGSSEELSCDISKMIETLKEIGALEET